MGEELDYMSDEFITNCLNSEKDVRPGLLKSHNEQREHNLMKKKNLAVETKKKSAQVLQVEALEESLKIPIHSTNKGFSMLQKMGFKSGMGLGKNNTGIVEPISISIKNDKGGLGHKKAQKQTKATANSESKLDKISESDYRAFLSKKNREREARSDLRKSQRICKELDSKKDRCSPEETWFWPEEESAEGEEEDSEKEEIDIPDSEKLELLTKYLREKYFYCIWCKVQYNDEKDLEDCPGVTRDDH